MIESDAPSTRPSVNSWGLRTEPGDRLWPHSAGGLPTQALTGGARYHQQRLSTHRNPNCRRIGMVSLVSQELDSCTGFCDRGAAEIREPDSNEFCVVTFCSCAERNAQRVAFHASRV